MNRERRRLRNASALFLAATLAAGQATAAAPSQNLVVTADRSTAITSPGSVQSRVTYEGHVVLTRGDAEIDGDRAVVYLVHQNLDRATVTGSPATFSWRPAGERPVTGNAHQITYFLKTDEVVLVGQVHVRRGGERFSAAEAHYLLKSGTLTAQGGTSPSAERVHVVMPPAGTTGGGRAEP